MSLFQRHMQLYSLPIEEIEQSAGFGCDDRFCYQLPGPIQNRHRNRFLVNIQADILDIATQHAGYHLGGKVILQPDHFPSRTERRVGPCREAPRAPTQWPRPIQGGAAAGAAASPFRYLLAESPYRERHKSAKSWGCGGKAPAGCAGHKCFLLKLGRPLIMHCYSRNTPQPSRGSSVAR